jgi:predicted metal-dependent RNase
MKKNKKELTEEAKKLAIIHQQKKDVIDKIFSDLDKEEKVTQKHLAGISAVNEILKELKEIEQEHEKILEQIRQD